jgi:hypothetical protein
MAVLRQLPSSPECSDLAKLAIQEGAPDRCAGIVGDEIVGGSLPYCWR